jgi:hypothetical protein
LEPEFRISSWLERYTPSATVAFGSYIVNIGENADERIIMGISAYYCGLMFASLEVTTRSQGE